MLINERKEGGFLEGEWRETGMIAGERQNRLILHQIREEDLKVECMI